jgi:hypothetical protein
MNSQSEHVLDSTSKVNLRIKLIFKLFFVFASLGFFNFFIAYVALGEKLDLSQFLIINFLPLIFALSYWKSSRIGFRRFNILMMYISTMYSVFYSFSFI